jgi:thioredoxin-like negative regulator of GroEL
MATAEAVVRPKLIFVHSPTSGPSRRVQGFLAQVLQRRGNHDTFQLYWLDVSKRPDMVKRFGVGTIPCLLVAAGNTIVARLEQPRGSAEIRSFLAPWLR